LKRGDRNTKKLLQGGNQKENDLQTIELVTFGPSKPGALDYEEYGLSNASGTIEQASQNQEEKTACKGRRNVRDKGFKTEAKPMIEGGARSRVGGKC